MNQQSASSMMRQDFDIQTSLRTLQQRIEGEFQLAGLTETKEPGMDRFNQDMWVNRTWEGRGIRRAHLDLVDARETKGLWMMHVCIMPVLSSDAPIYGFDVIAGKKKITGAFLDYSPGAHHQHEMMYVFRSITQDLKWKKERELPDWAKAIFSDDMVAAGNIQDEMETIQITRVALTLLQYYLDNVRYTVNRADEEMVAKIQNHYARHQKMNPHTPKVMKSLGLPEADVDLFVDKCLFPEIDMEQFHA